MEEELKGYQKLIAEIVPNVDPRWIEAWMRTEHATLDGISREAFQLEALVARDLARASSPGFNNCLASSFGL